MVSLLHCRGSGTCRLAFSQACFAGSPGFSLMLSPPRSMNRRAVRLSESDLAGCLAVHLASLPRRAPLTVPPHRTPDGLPEQRSVGAEGSREGGMIHNERLFELVEHLDRLA